MTYKQWCAVLMLVCVSLAPTQTSTAETFIGEIPTGLMSLEDYKYPVFLYVPDQYNARRPMPLVVLIPGEGKSLEDNVEAWTGIAKRKSMILLVPTLLLPREGDAPYALDEWILGMKKDVALRYRISKKRVFLVGIGGGARYAAYLALKNPQEFSAAGLLDGSWVGPLEKLVKPQSEPADQIPFFVSLSSKAADSMDDVEARATVYSQKGYPVHLERLDDKESFDERDFQKRMFSWLEEKSSNWDLVIRESQKGWKKRLKKWYERNTKVV